MPFPTLPTVSTPPVAWPTPRPRCCRFGVGDLYWSDEERLRAQKRLADKIYDPLDDEGRLALVDELDKKPLCPWYRNTCSGTRLLLAGKLMGWRLANLIVSTVTKALADDDEKASVGYAASD